MGLLDELFGTLVKLDPDQQKFLIEKTRRMVVADGRAARRAGLPRDHRTGRFSDNDMCIDWSNGWRWEDEEIRERERVRKLSGRQKG